MFTLEDYLTSFTGSLIPHAVLAVDGKGNQVRVGGRTCLLSRTGKAELKKKLGGGF